MLDQGRARKRCSCRLQDQVYILLWWVSANDVWFHCFFSSKLADCAHNIPLFQQIKQCTKGTAQRLQIYSFCTSIVNVISILKPIPIIWYIIVWHYFCSLIIAYSYCVTIARVIGCQWIKIAIFSTFNHYQYISCDN